jgi:hypothetical protein
MLVSTSVYCWFINFGFSIQHSNWTLFICIICVASFDVFHNQILLFIIFCDSGEFASTSTSFAVMIIASSFATNILSSWDTAQANTSEGIEADDVSKQRVLEKSTLNQSKDTLLALPQHFLHLALLSGLL